MLPEERHLARKQIMRLGQMNRFPNIPEVLTDLIDALMTAPTEEIAKTVIGEILSVANPETNCPMPQQIREAVAEKLDPYLPDPDCLTCKGTGDIHTERNGYHYSKLCPCHARRPAPKYPRPGDQPIGDFKSLIGSAAKKLTGVTK